VSAVSRIVLALLLAWAPVVSAVCVTECLIAPTQARASTAQMPQGHDCGGMPEAPVPDHDDGVCMCAATVDASLALKTIADTPDTPAALPLDVAPASLAPHRAGVVACGSTMGPPGRGDLTLRLRNLPLLI